MKRKYDIILFGATGFTGSLVAQYLDEHIDKEGLSWAIAGRNREKLEAIRQTLHTNPELMLAESNNKPSLDKMTSSCTILMNTAGPFNRNGKSVVESCLQNRTHYLDITGEPSFVSETYNTFFDVALQNQVCIVNCCGFDSIPADISAYLTASHLPVEEPKLLQLFIRTNAGISGGTITTAIQALHMESQKTSHKTHLPKHPDAPRPKLYLHYNKEMNGWAIPIPVVDHHIVRRSAMRMPEIYGYAFGFGEYFLRSNFYKAFKMIITAMSVMSLVRFKPIRDRLYKKFPPGTGPDAERRATSRFEVTCIGRSKTKEARTIISGMDPGYDETAKMFSQAAFSMMNMLLGSNPKYGVLTPAEAFGDILVRRLQKEGISITTT
ncbi:MAG: saccharopine dehydrogenase NADP-binding domain-containing protein [Saprospiraceae bacterium]|nr:MAG: saccharopine dehydrogenase [Bacteroidetes bacterium OLB9]MCO6463626.1 saccharopine dehydrogenase NADP-binding domain-containing protein [Saprospiraceae bacterium]MCZ2337869.1 saccharopine dehydrogenase NADP-binding domain-containing protein [Chitinophagales bacterium]